MCPTVSFVRGKDSLSKTGEGYSAAVSMTIEVVLRAFNKLDEVRQDQVRLVSKADNNLSIRRFGEGSHEDLVDPFRRSPEVVPAETGAAQESLV